MKKWKSTVAHLFVALLLTVLILALAWLPPELVEAFGCRNRGLWAAVIALGSGGAGLVMAISAVVGRLRGKPATGHQVVCSLAYSLPLALVLWFS